MKIRFLFLPVLLIPILGRTQEIPPTALLLPEEGKIHSAMGIMSGLSVASAASSAAWLASGDLQGSATDFHRMNLGWSAVNLAIFSSAWLGTRPSVLLRKDLSYRQEQARKWERLFLINAGLDVVYMGAGAALWALGSENGDRQQRLQGFGQAVLMNGAILLAYDGIMWAVLRKERKRALLLPKSVP